MDGNKDGKHILFKFYSQKNFVGKLLRVLTLDVKKKEGFPGGAVVESACQCGGHGFEPWSGKIPHAVEQLRP